MLTFYIQANGNWHFLVSVSEVEALSVWAELHKEQIIFQMGKY